jgi:hypothetical protein
MSTDNRKYLQYEPVPTTLTLLNQSSFDIEFGRYTQDAQLKLQLKLDRGVVSERVLDTPEVLEKTVPSGKSAEFTVDLSRIFDVREPRRYLVAAAVEWRGREYPAKSRYISVVNGIRIASETRGLPMAPETIREYTLHYHVRSDAEHLFLTVNGDTEDVCFGVFDLGRIIRVYQPVMKFDHIGNLRVIHHSGHGVNTHSYLISDLKGVRFLETLYRTPEGDEIKEDRQRGGKAPGFDLDR